MTTLEFTQRELKMLSHIVSQSKAASETMFISESEMTEAQRIFSAMHTRIIEAAQK